MASAIDRPASSPERARFFNSCAARVLAVAVPLVTARTSSVNSVRGRLGREPGDVPAGQGDVLDAAPDDVPVGDGDDVGHPVPGIYYRPRERALRADRGEEGRARRGLEGARRLEGIHTALETLACKPGPLEGDREIVCEIVCEIIIV